MFFAGGWVFYIATLLYVAILVFVLWLVFRLIRSNERIADNTERIARVLEEKSLKNRDH